MNVCLQAQAIDIKKSIDHEIVTNDALKHNDGGNIVDGWKLHYNNAPANTAFLVTSYLAEVKIPTIPQPSYIPVPP